MSGAAAAAAGRAAAEALMTTTCTIREAGAGTVTDPTTGAVTAAPGPVVYAGRCRVKPAVSLGRTGEAGGAQISPSSFIVSVPFAVAGVNRGQLVTIDSSPDPWLTGRRFEIRFTPEAGDSISARRLVVEEETS